MKKIYLKITSLMLCLCIHLHCLPLTRTPGNPTKKTEAAFFTLPPFLGCL